MLAVLISLAAEEETSKTPFYLLGGGLAGTAFLISFVGIRAHGTFPGSPAVARALMGLFLLLVAGAMVTAVVTA
jgi:hypothetical protein